jgi:hypothetical protein
MFEKTDKQSFAIQARKKSGKWQRACDLNSKGYMKYYHTHYMTHGCSQSLTQVDTAEPKDEPEPQDESDKTPPAKDNSPPKHHNPPPPSADVALMETSETSNGFWSREVIFSDEGKLWCKKGKYGGWTTVSSFLSDIFDDHWHTWFFCFPKQSALLQETMKEVQEIDTIPAEIDAVEHLDGQHERAVNLIEFSQNSSSRTNDKPIPSCNTGWYKKTAWYKFNMFVVSHHGDELQMWCGNGDHHSYFSYNAGSLWRVTEIQVIHPDQTRGSYYDQYLCKLKCK